MGVQLIVDPAASQLPLSNIPNLTGGSFLTHIFASDTPIRGDHEEGDEVPTTSDREVIITSRVDSPSLTSSSSELEKNILVENLLPRAVPAVA